MLLIACPACARQYDATGHEPGSEVRCACDERFTVRFPERFEAEVLTCSHCGAAIGPDDEQCGHCDAAVPEASRTHTTLCPGCGTRIADDSAHCRACGLTITPQRLAPLPVDKGCPRCDGTLRARTTATSSVIECGSCLGIWITPESFQRVAANAVRRSTAGHDFGVPVDDLRPEALPDVARYIRCPTCRTMMNRRQYRHGSRSSGVVIDHCRDHGVWLDHSELPSIVTFLEGYADPSAEPMAGLVSPPARSATKQPEVAIPSGPPKKDALEIALDVFVTAIGVLFSPRRY